MRKLVVTENITLDGVIDMAEGWFDPLNEDVDLTDIRTANAEHTAAADALLVGRKHVRELPRVLAAADRRSDGRLRLPQRGGQVRRLRHAGRPRGGSTPPCCAAPLSTRCVG